MPKPVKMGVSLTTSQLDALKLSLNSIKDTLNGLITINLTKKERKSLQSVAEERLPYVKKAFDVLIDDNPKMQPSFRDLPGAKKNYEYMMQLQGLMIMNAQIMEIIVEHYLASGTLAFDYVRDFYNIAKRAAQSNLPGADSVVEALAPLFERGNKKPNIPQTTAGGGNPTV